MLHKIPQRINEREIHTLTSWVMLYDLQRTVGYEI